MADGDYTLTLTPLDRARNAGPSQAVAVTVFGSFVGLGSSPARFYPQDGDAIAPRSQAMFTLKRAATVRLTVVNNAGTTVRTIAGPYPAGPVAIAWDGRADGGGFVPQGPYRLLVVATVGDRSETHKTSVRAAAFELKTSVTSGQAREATDPDGRHGRGAEAEDEAQADRPPARPGRLCRQADEDRPDRPTGRRGR